MRFNNRMKSLHHPIRNFMIRIILKHALFVFQLFVLLADSLPDHPFQLKI